MGPVFSPVYWKLAGIVIFNFQVRADKALAPVTPEIELQSDPIGGSFQPDSDMLGFFESLFKLLKFEKITTDNVVFRMHYKVKPDQPDQTRWEK